MCSRNILVIVSIFSLLSILSCNKKEDSKPKVAMLAQGTTFSDQSFLQSCKEGMDKAVTDFNLEIEYNIDTSTNNYQSRLENYCSNNYSLVIAIGYMWNDAVIEISNKYPDTKFILVDTELSETRSNVISIVFDVDEAAFPIGFLSAWWSETQGTDNPETAYIGALEIPQIKQFTETFNNGVSFYNQKYSRNVESHGVFAGTFFSEDLGKHLCDSLINNGADIIFAVGSETASGALLQAKSNGIWAIGTDVDQYYSFPEVADIMLTTAVKGLDKSIYNVIKSFSENNFEGGTTYHGKLENSGVAMAPYHNAENIIADSIKAEIEIIKAEIISGNLSTGWPN